MNYIPQKEHKTQVLKKSLQPNNKPHHRHPPRDVIDQSLRQQLCKRQHVIEKIYKRSVANKLYIFPRMPEDIDNVSLGSNESIDEMDSVERYKLTSQNHQSNATVKNNINYFSQRVVSHDSEESKTRIDLRNFRTKVNSNSRLLDSTSAQKIVYSGRIHPQKLLFKGQSSKRKDQNNSSFANKQLKPKHSSSIYQQIINKVGLRLDKDTRDKSNSTSNVMKKSNFTYRKIKVETTSHDKLKDRYKRMNGDTSHNISVSKILEKYRTSSRKKEERCKTQY